MEVEYVYICKNIHTHTGKHFPEFFKYSAYLVFGFLIRIQIAMRYLTTMIAFIFDLVTSLFSLDLSHKAWTITELAIAYCHYYYSALCILERYISSELCKQRCIY